MVSKVSITVFYTAKEIFFFPLDEKTVIYVLAFERGLHILYHLAVCNHTHLSLTCHFSE